MQRFVTCVTFRKLFVTFNKAYVRVKVYLCIVKM